MYRLNKVGRKVKESRHAYGLNRLEGRCIYRKNTTGRKTNRQENLRKQTQRQIGDRQTDIQAEKLTNTKTGPQSDRRQEDG